MNRCIRGGSKRVADEGGSTRVAIGWIVGKTNDFFVLAPRERTPPGHPSAVRQPLGNAPEKGIHAAHGEGACLGIGCMKDGPDGVSCSHRSGHWCTLIHLGLRERM